MKKRKKFNIASKLLLIGTIFVIFPIVFNILELSIVLTAGLWFPQGLMTVIDYVPYVGYGLIFAALLLMYHLTNGTQYAFITFVFYILATIFFHTYTYFIPSNYLLAVNNCKDPVMSLLEILYMYLLMSGMIEYLRIIGEGKNLRRERKNLKIFTAALAIGFLFSILATIFSSTILDTIFSLCSSISRCVAYVVFFIFIAVASRRED